MKKDTSSKEGQKIAQILDDIEHVIMGNEAKIPDPIDEIAPQKHSTPPPKKEKGDA